MQIDRGDAIDWLEHRLQAPPAKALHLVFHTIAWLYFPKTAQARGAGLLEQAGAGATAAAPLAHLSMEFDGVPGSAVIGLQLWPSGEKLAMGCGDFHRRWLDWQAPDA